MFIDKEFSPLLFENLKFCLLLYMQDKSQSLQVFCIVVIEAQIFVEWDTGVSYESIFTIYIALLLDLV